MPVGPDAILLQLAGEVRDEHVLIIGPRGLEIMCALLREGAAEAILLRDGMRRDSGPADLAIVTEAGSLDRMATTINLARHALGAAGRIILRIATDPTQRLARAAARTLKMSGFSAVRIRAIGGCAFVAGEIPSFGPFVRVSPCPTF
jgi:hypothetical protein